MVQQKNFGGLSSSILLKIEHFHDSYRDGVHGPVNMYQMTQYLKQEKPGNRLRHSGPTY